MTLYTLNSYTNIYIYQLYLNNTGGKIRVPKKWDLGREHWRFTDLLKSIAKYHSAYAWEETNWDWRQNLWEISGRKVARENTGLGIRSPLRGRPFHKNTDSIGSVQPLSCVQLFQMLWTAAHQASLSIATPRADSDSCPHSWWRHATTSSSVIPFVSCLNLSQHKSIF